MLNRLRKNNEGFTIIEVMIVLAIAGLILLIVLLAVPAVQRNSRNTAIKNDASTLAGSISTFEANNSGQTPNTFSATGLISYVVGGQTVGSTEQAKLQGSTTVNTINAQPNQAVITHGQLSVWPGHNCAGTANLRATAIWYSIETTSAETPGSNNICIDS